jgi:hypothetical protein
MKLLFVLIVTALVLYGQSSGTVVYQTSPIYIKAVCDGATDNLAAFNAAITALPSSGGTLIVPRGICVLSGSVTFGKTIDLIGQGDGFSCATAGTCLKFAAGSSGLIISGGERSYVANMYIDSLSSALGTDDGIRVRSNSVRLERLTINNFGRDGVNVDSTGVNANTGTVTSVRVNGGYRHGFYFYGADSNGWTLTGASVQGSAGYCYNMDYNGSNLVFNNTLIGPHAENCVLGAYIDRGSDNQYYNAYSEPGVGHTITLGANSQYSVWYLGGSALNGAPITNSGGNPYYQYQDSGVKSGIFRVLTSDGGTKPRMNVADTAVGGHEYSLQSGTYGATFLSLVDVTTPANIFFYEPVSKTFRFLGDFLQSSRGFQDMSTGAKPTCAVDQRGFIYVEKGATDVADAAFICVKKADNTYAWGTIGLTVP